MDSARKTALCHGGPQHRTKLKPIDRFGEVNGVNSSNFNATTIRFSEKFDHPFSHIFIFSNMISESHGLIATKLYQRYMFQFIPI